MLADMELCSLGLLYFNLKIIKFLIISRKYTFPKVEIFSPATKQCIHLRPYKLISWNERNPPPLLMICKRICFKYLLCPNCITLKILLMVTHILNQYLCFWDCMYRVLHQGAQKFQVSYVAGFCSQHWMLHSGLYLLEQRFFVIQSSCNCGLELKCWCKCASILFESMLTVSS